MRTLIFYALVAINCGMYCQNSQNEQSNQDLQLQLDLLEVHNNQIENELKLLRRSYSTKSPRLPLKKEKPKKPTYASIESIIGITDNEGVGYHANFNIEINNEKHSGVEMGLFYDANDILLSQNLEVPSEVFIFNLGYTKQIGFLSNKTETISTRIAIGGVVGAEVLNDGDDQLITGEVLGTESGLIYGGYLGVFSLFKINDTFSAIFRNSNYITTSDVSLHKFIVGAGIRYHF